MSRCRNRTHTAKGENGIPFRLVAKTGEECSCELREVYAKCGLLTSVMIVRSDRTRALNGSLVVGDRRGDLEEDRGCDGMRCLGLDFDVCTGV